MKSFSDYLDSPEGTVPATGKTFELYGMIIGKFQQVIGTNVLFVRGPDDIMEVPIAINSQKVMPGLPKGNALNPILKDIKEA